MARNVKQLVVGLPSTGKTTFLAALYHIVDSAEIPGAMRLTKLAGSTEHLERIRGEWLACNPVGRTSLKAEDYVSLSLECEGIGEVEVILPDLSGETYRGMWKSRLCPKSLAEHTRDAEAILLFVHPDTLIDPLRIEDVNPYVEVVRTGAQEPEEGSQGTSWDPDVAPTQVQLVDLLQSLRGMMRHVGSVSISIIVSAWDKAKKEDHTPDEWIRIHLPMLDQFLAANEDRFTARIFGISATGGDLQDASVVNQLRSYYKHSEIVEVRGPDVSQHDITAPLRWTLLV